MLPTDLGPLDLRLGSESIESIPDSEPSALCLVSIHAPLGRRLFMYRCPPEMGSSLAAGDAVLVPFGGRESIGWVIQTNAAPDDAIKDGQIKSVLERIDGAGLSPEDLRLCQSLQSYYGTNFSDILALFVPPVAPKIVRRIECVSPAAGVDLARFSEPARAIAAAVLEHDGAIDLSKARLVAGLPAGAARFKRALDELAAAGSFAVRAALVSVRPGRKKFLGASTDEEMASAGIVLSETQKKIFEVARRHPFQFGAAELAKLARAKVTEVRTLARNHLLVERTSRVWRTPLERGSEAREGGQVVTERPPPQPATPSQARAIAEIVGAIDAGRSDRFLLYGPTASGKTFVYEAAAQRALALGRQVLLLVPEIALTKPLIDRIRNAVPEPVAVVHSRQTKAERRDEWQRAASGEAKLLVGPRSAMFVPMPQLGLIIIDECHDAGYKQSESPYLDARTVAEEKARLKGIPLVIGSATPTVEQLFSARVGGIYRRVDLTEFPTRINRPEVTVVNLRKSGNQSSASRPATFLSVELDTLLTETLGRGESAVLLLNRRGYAPEIICPSCGYGAKCQACLIGMTYHAQDRHLLCHSCGLIAPPPQTCPACSYTPLGYMGVGTERIEEACRRRFPKAKIARLDQDVMRRNRREAFEILTELKNGKIDILIGTQMIAKGLDVPKVTLAAVVFADVGLHLPDFRSRERTFHLLAQLIGRSGRHSAPGRAVLQTFQPDNPAITCSLTEDIERFYEDELEIRRVGNWPPFCRVHRILLRSANAPRALQAARQIHGILTAEMGLAGIGVNISPPLPAPRPKWNGEYRFQMILRTPPMTQAPTAWFDRIQSECRMGQVKLVIEPDPISIL